MEVLFYTDELLNHGVLHLPSFSGRKGVFRLTRLLEHFLVCGLLVYAIMFREQRFLNLLNLIQVCYLWEKSNVQ